MSLTRFRLDVPALADPHMRGENVQTLLGAFGAQLDAMSEQVMQARLQANPFAGGANPTREGAARLADGRLIECDELVLGVHADQRGIQLYGTEPLLSRRVRTSRHLQLKARRGTHRGEMEHMQPYFLPGTQPMLRVVHQDGAGAGATWHTLTSAGAYSVKRTQPSNWYFDSFPDQPYRWWLILYPPAGYVRAEWDAFTWDDGTLWDGTSTYFTEQQLADIVAMAKDWKGSHSTLWGVILCWDPTKLSPTETPGVQDADGWYNLPDAGQWQNVYSLVDGRGTRPPYLEWIYDLSQP